MGRRHMRLLLALCALQVRAAQPLGVPRVLSVSRSVPRVLQEFLTGALLLALALRAAGARCAAAQRAARALDAGQRPRAARGRVAGREERYAAAG